MCSAAHITRAPLGPKSQVQVKIRGGPYSQIWNYIKLLSKFSNASLESKLGSICRLCTTLISVLNTIHNKFLTGCGCVGCKHNTSLSFLTNLDWVRFGLEIKQIRGGNISAMHFFYSFIINVTINTRVPQNIQIVSFSFFHSFPGRFGATDDIHKTFFIISSSPDRSLETHFGISFCFHMTFMIFRIG